MAMIVSSHYVPKGYTLFGPETHGSSMQINAMLRIGFGFVLSPSIQTVVLKFSIDDFFETARYLGVEDFEATSCFARDEFRRSHFVDVLCGVDLVDPYSCLR